MCGIAGILTRDPTVPTALDRMVAALTHRGPNDSGWLTAGAGVATRLGRGPVPGEPTTVALGHRRLSIIDLTTAGWQPMCSPDGRWAVTFNGEIYNYVELREELADDGWEFQSTGDTEVLVAAWAAWGAGALPRLRGMFAFCAADLVESRAYLVRDHFGIKPLFVAAVPTGVVFASETAGLLEHPDVSRQVDPQRLYEYLRYGQVDHGDATMFQGIRQVPAAGVIELDLRAPALGAHQSYWHVPEPRERTFADAVDAVRAAFEHSISIHLRSDVPIGTALSGGIDSSAIACAARAVAGRDQLIHSFSYVADDARFDESEWARVAAEAAGIEITWVRGDSGALRTELADLIRSQGEPFGGTSIFAQRRVFAAASEAGIPVLLDGQGADELFGGYRSYLAAMFAGMVKRGRLGAAARLAAGAVRMPDVRPTPRMALRVVAGAAPEPVRRVLLRGAGQDPFPGWLNRAWFEDREVVGSRVTPSDLDEALVRAFTDTSLPALLRYEDRNSMRYSIESRVPFLDLDFVELVFTLPRDHLVKADGTSKWVFREAMRGLVPDAILDRRDKIGFTTPEDRWLASEQPWVDEVLRQAANDPWFGPGVRTLRSSRSVGTADSHLVWRALNVSLWAEAVGAAA